MDIDCTHSNFDPVEHDYCPDCGESDTDKIELVLEIERLKEKVAYYESVSSGKVIARINDLTNEDK